MTGQAVNIFDIGVIKWLLTFLPANSDVAGHAFLLVTLGADAKIVELIRFADRDRFIPPRNIERLTFPGPVGGGHDLLAASG